ncbi:MAG TPA: alcohol dehydrogenase catalytic domain-containing protein [Pseudonocardiaceae bacterium]|jgi:2-desacetyl-2-hydroxyethyl bacteriochlorophyllide A dehydrogenase|nr:alcohol dehydrogenase catalytic domain-containing protein [Pseudonocardiaceae bacterium]
MSADIPTRATAVLLSAPGVVEVTEVAVRPPLPDELLIRVEAAGICGSDVELFAGNRPADIVRYPVVPGHEWAGRVASVGSRVSGFTPGDPVVAQGLRWCGQCARCLEGSTNLCLAGYRETGFTESGAFAEYLLVPARLAHRLPEDRPLEHAALLEPTACVVAALRAGAPTTGQRMVVVGGGTLGLIAVQLLAGFAPTELVLVEGRARGRELGARFGATATVDPDELDAAGLGADLVIEAAGAAGTGLVAARATRRGGTVVLLGIPGDDATPLPPAELAVRELHLHGVFGARADCWPIAIEYFAAGRLDLGAMISHRFPLPDITAAVATAGGHSPDLGKVLLRPKAN